MADEPEWPLHECFKALYLPIAAHKKNKLSDALADGKFRRNLAKSVSSDGVTLYATYKMPSIVHLPSGKALFAIHAVSAVTNDTTQQRKKQKYINKAIEKMWKRSNSRVKSQLNSWAVQVKHEGIAGLRAVLDAMLPPGAVSQPPAALAATRSQQTEVESCEDEGFESDNSESELSGGDRIRPGA